MAVGRRKCCEQDKDGEATSQKKPEQSDRQHIVVRKDKTVNNTITKVSFDQVVYGYWTNKIGRLGKFGGETVYITEQSTLKDMHAAFKGYCKMVNRNYIVPQNALAQCIKRKDGYLLVLKEKTPTDITISKEKFQELREWILAVVDIEIEK
ncbi:hypothetical protein FAZ15_13470 [Sphingobacterium olei]|uniref:Uncharacterized protein n=1 Tax=Sphingobacterium olei TaxID=2571155 RepID=A0A4V5MM66_9SPHI|nr:hypothetical protein [Sphingobacterium olei]TJZ59898.1 hypothetical protein FAZ15_13470 [Sphingobacterium olei]